MFLTLLMTAVQVEQVVLRSVEAIPADPWAEVISGSCGSQRLELRRPMRPLSERPAVLLNGALVRGDIRPLELELSRVGAAYRFSIQCAPESETVLLNWVSGLVGDDGQVEHRAGFAAFRDGALTEARSEKANEETFWYR